MKKAAWAALGIFVSLFILGATIAEAAGRWDGEFVYRGVVSADGGGGGTTNCFIYGDGGTLGLQALNGGHYINLRCGQTDTYVATGAGIPGDGGQAGFINYLGGCVLDGGANQCRLVNFSLGEQFYEQMTPSSTHVCIFGANSCFIYDSSN